METVMFIVGSLIIVSINGWVTWYFSYEKKKGENKAIKEDIQEITKLTKTIESELSHLTQNRINLSSERRNAIIEYNYELSQLKYHVQFQMLSKSETGNEIIMEYFKTIYPKYSYSESKLLLFVDLKELKDKVDEINQTLIDFIKEAAYHIDQVKLLKQDTSEQGIKKVLDHLKRNVDESQRILVLLASQFDGIRSLLRTLLTNN